MLRSLNRRLYRTWIAVRHPGVLIAPWCERGLRPLDAVHIECAGPAGTDPVSVPLMTRAVYRLAAGKTFPHARAVVFTGRSDPLLHGELREMILAARSYGKEARVATDGILLDEGTICVLVGAGTDHLAVFTAPAGSPESARAARNIEILAMVKAKLGVSHPALELLPPGSSAIPARCVEISWDGKVYPGGALRGAKTPEPIGEVGALSPRAILSALSSSP